MRSEWEIINKIRSHERYLRRTNSKSSKLFQQCMIDYIYLLKGGKEYSESYKILRKIQLERPLNYDERALVHAWMWWRK
jgi:hypothetical protein